MTFNNYQLKIIDFQLNLAPASTFLCFDTSTGLSFCLVVLITCFNSFLGPTPSPGVPGSDPDPGGNILITLILAPSAVGFTGHPFKSYIV